MAIVVFRSGSSGGGNSTPSGFSLAGLSNLTFSTQAGGLAVGRNAALGTRVDFVGTGFTYVSGQLAGGTVTSIELTNPDNSGVDFSELAVPVATLNGWIQSNQTAAFLATTLAGNDRISGTPANDTLEGYGGDDTLEPQTGADILLGDDGVDTVVLPVPVNATVLSGTPTGQATLTGPGLSDTFSSVERLQFVDGTRYYDAGSSAAQVVRMYEAALGRAPDSLGLAFWTSALSGGASLNQLASSFIGSAEFQARFPGAAQTPTSFVTQLYANVLQRAPDSGGLAHWTGLLQNGTLSQADVLHSFSESQENQARTAPLIANGVFAADEQAAQVARLYYSTLGRAPDTAGLIYWTGQNAGAQLQQVAEGLVSSQEFQSQYGALSNQAFVDRLYLNVLGRPADAAGEAFWTGQINSGAATRAAAVTGFSESPEHRTLLAPKIEQSGVLLS